VNRDGTVDLWSVPETGDYAADNATGRHIAEAVLSDMRDSGAPILLGHVAKAIAAKGRHGGVEVGFWHTIASATI